MTRYYPTLAPVETDTRKIVQAVRQTIDGKTNNTGTITLDASVATTKFIDARCGAESVIVFMATTANAASEMATGAMYVSTRGKQNFILTHTNNVQTDRTFDYIIVG